MLHSVGWFRTDVSGLRIGPETSVQNLPEKEVTPVS
jgi:hypothetical protein